MANAADLHADERWNAKPPKITQLMYAELVLLFERNRQTQKERLDDLGKNWMQVIESAADMTQLCHGLFIAGRRRCGEGDLQNPGEHCGTAPIPHGFGKFGFAGS